MLRGSAEPSCSTVGPEREPRVRRAAGLTVVAAVLTLGCAGSPGDPATTADRVCNVVVELVNGLADLANETAAAVSTDPGSARELIVAAFERADAVVEHHRRAIDRLDEDSLVDGPALIDDLGRGVDEARAELVDERRRFLDQPDVAADDVGGWIGQFFMSIEKVMAVVEPVAADHPDLTAAFASTPSCEFVVQ